MKNQQSAFFWVIISGLIWIGLGIWLMACPESEAARGLAIFTLIVAGIIKGYYGFFKLFPPEEQKKW